ncbi:MAG TPA: hypothetical protein VF042_07025 [Gemmatimonadaceae bacterium]
MHRRLRLSLLATTLIALSATDVVAQRPQGPGRPTAGIFGGYTGPTGDFGDEVGNGWHVGALIKMRLYGALDGRIDGTYAKFGKKDIPGEEFAFHTDANTAFATFDAHINLGPDSAAYPGDNSVSPHIVLGLGVYQLDYKVTCSGQCTDFIGAEKKTHWGLNVGAGATAPIAGLRTFFEARYHRIMRDTFEDGGSRAMFLASVGIKFR